MKFKNLSHENKMRGLRSLLLKLLDKVIELLIRPCTFSDIAMNPLGTMILVLLLASCQAKRQDNHHFTCTVTFKIDCNPNLHASVIFLCLIPLRGS